MHPPLTLCGSSLLAEKPKRIVSLNLCTDQLLMMLVDSDRIAAVSYLSRNEDTSVMAQQARKLPLAYGFAEEILTLKSDLVLAGTFTTRPTVALLKRLGHNVLVVPPAYSLDDIRKNVRLVAAAVGEEEKGAALIDAFDQRLKRLARPPSDPKFTIVTYYANNYTSGSNTLADDVIRAAGFRQSDCRHRDTRRRPAVPRGADRSKTRPGRAWVGRARNYNTVTADNLRHPALKVFLEDGAASEHSR